MKIKEFVEELIKTNDENKEEYIAGHITEDYVPYLSKMVLCDRVINASCYADVEGEKVFRINSPAQYMLLVMGVIYQYTDLEQGESIVADFDFLDQYGLVDAIIGMLPEGEYDTIRALLDMMIGDIRENERSLVSYIDNKIKSSELVMNALGEVFSDILKEVDADGTDGSVE